MANAGSSWWSSGWFFVSAAVARALFAARGALYFAVFAVLGEGAGTEPARGACSVPGAGLHRS